MQQMQLSFEPGIAQRYESLRECVATQVYQRGHGRIAGQLDLAPSRLTEKLAGMRSDGKASGLTLDEFERYLAVTGDATPIFWLVDRFCRDPAAQQAEAIARLPALVQQIEAVLRAASSRPTAPSSARRR